MRYYDKRLLDRATARTTDLGSRVCPGCGRVPDYAPAVTTEGGFRRFRYVCESCPFVFVCVQHTYGVVRRGVPALWVEVVP